MTMLLLCLYSEVKIKGISKTFCKQFSRDYAMTKIGRSQLRIEDDRFLRGRGQYTDDIRQSNDATLVFVRSPHAAARIVKVDLDRAKTIEGVIAIFGWDEMYANNAGSFKPRAQFPGPDNGAMRIPPFTPLADGYVRYCGEPVLGIIAKDLSLIHISSPRDGLLSRMPSSA